MIIVGLEMQIEKSINNEKEKYILINYSSWRETVYQQGLRFYWGTQVDIFNIKKKKEETLF